MKILIFSDLHLHNWAYGSTLIDGMNSRLRDQARVLDQIAMYCEWNEVDHIVFGGDLFHTHGKIDASVLKVAYEGVENILAKSNTYMTVLVGNHDTADKSMNTHSLHWLRAFGEQVRVVDRVWHDMEMDISFLNYTEDKEEIEKFFRMSQPLCFMHQGVAKVPMGSGFLIDEILTQDMIPAHVDHVFTGHYHQHNRVSNQLTVIGSTLQLNWADEGDRRGFIVYDTNTNKVEHIESVAPKFVTIDFNTLSEELANKNMGDSFREKTVGNFLRVKLADGWDNEEVRADLMDAGARSVEFVFNNPKVKLAPVKQSDGFNLLKLVEEYEQQKEVTPERRKVGEELRK